MPKIYTRTGDDGTTRLRGAHRVSKTDPRIQAVGELDALNATIGWAAIQNPELHRHLMQIQSELLCAGAVVAGYDPTMDHRQAAETLEQHIDRLEAELPPLTQFLLPGGSEASARLHIARNDARRAERTLIGMPDAPEAIIIYLNRLSDLLFVMARVANKRGGHEDLLWDSAAV